MLDIDNISLANRPAGKTEKKIVSNKHYGTIEYVRANKDLKRQKKNRGDFYLPLSGYVWNQFLQKSIFYDNQLEMENSLRWFAIMPVNFELD